MQFSCYHAQTLCWNCANATGGCSWSEYGTFQPVEGWTAERRDIRNKFGEDIESYIVIDCPEFIRDAQAGGSVRV